jgi:rare lipoprotein A
MIRVFILSLLLFSTTLSVAQTHHVYQAKATYYAQKFNGRKTYSGERYNNKKYTAAHRNFPLQSLVKVTNPRNNKSVIVRINDRFHRKNMIDLSIIAAKKLGILGQGTAKVKLQLLDNTFALQYQYQYSDSSIIQPIDDTALVEEYIDTTQIYYIRLATFKLKKNAEQDLNKRLAQEYHDLATIKKLYHHGKPIYKIILGPFKNKEDAYLLQKKLNAKFKDAKVV